jgi:hypothetical protein
MWVLLRNGVVDMFPHQWINTQPYRNCRKRCFLLDPSRGYTARNNEKSHQRMLHKDYDRKGSVAKQESLVVRLKGLDIKKNWLEANGQPSTNSDSEVIWGLSRRLAVLYCINSRCLATTSDDRITNRRLYVCCSCSNLKCVNQRDCNSYL